MSESRDLFNDFPSITDDDWKDKIIADLKGKSFEETLQWTDEDNLLHQPYYRSSDIDKNELIKEIQAAQKTNSSWQSIQTFSCRAEELKDKIKGALSEGVDEVVVNDVSSLEDIKGLEDSLKDSSRVHFHLNSVTKKGLPKKYFFGPISEMLKEGKRNEEQLSNLDEIFQKRLNQLKPDNFLLVDGSLFRNAGSTLVQELAFTLHQTVEYLDILTDAGYTPEAICRSFTFKLGYGTSYFSEIAKTRAFRFLVKKVYEAYQVNFDVRIWGEPSTYNLAHKDPYTNLLRLTSQCMSAVLGNCDLVSLPPYDFWGDSSSLGHRMSKNIPLILKNESYFDKVVDLSAGSYYIENLTSRIAQSAWRLFLEIEQKGKLLDQIENNSITKLLEETRNKRNSFYKDENKAMIGVNQYLNPENIEYKIEEDDRAGLPKSILSKEINQ